MSLSRYVMRETAKYFFGARSAWTYPLTKHLGLFTTLPADPDAAGVEVTGAWYGRISTPGFTDWHMVLTPSLYQAASNVRAFSFGPATAALTVVGFGLWDAASGGNLLIYGPLTTPLYVRAGQGVYLPPEALAIVASSWLTGVIAALTYVMPDPFGNPATYRPTAWTLTPLIAAPTFDDYTAGYARNLPPDGAYSAALTNDATSWPLVAGDVTNGAALTFAEALTDWPDVTHFLLTGSLGFGVVSPYWLAALDAAVSVRQGERLEIPAGSLRLVDL